MKPGYADVYPLLPKYAESVAAPAAHEVGEDSAARSAARAAGQAMAIAHVPTHSLSTAIYALQAIRRAAISSDADSAVAKERDWQYHHLLESGENEGSINRDFIA